MDELAPVEDQDTEMDLRRRDDALKSAIADRESSAIGRDTDNLSIDRATAIAYYLGQPFGNEIEGRSQVVSKDVFDTIEWIKPSLLRIFAGGDRVAEFPPQNEEDVQAAEQESDYINYVILRKNNWFRLANEWFTDSLLTRNAYCMAYWESWQEAKLERYTGLTEDQLVLIGMDPTVQIVAHVAYPAPAPIPPGPMALQAIQQGMLQAFPQMMLHDVDVRKVRDAGGVKLRVLPPERCLIAGDAPAVSVRECDFFEFWEFKTISALRADGFDIPDDISDTSSTPDKGLVDQQRDVVNNTSWTDQEQTTDPTMRKVKARMIWVRNDYDGDGIAELRYVIAVGETFLVNQEVSAIPVASIVPYPMAHRHVGLSIFDAVADLQIIKSAMQRQVIDNTYLANNGRTAVDKNQVNLDDMLVSRPGGVVRVNGPPMNAIMPFVHPQTAQHGISVLQYFDAIREDRGGVSKPFAGADLEAINAQPGTIAQLTAASSQKIEQIARVLAEGVRELFLIVHEVILANPTVTDKVQLRGKWVTVDPRTWQKRTDMNLAVGLGVGNRQAHLAGVTALLGLQERALGIGLTSPPKIYNALSEYTKALGFASCEQFFDEPDPQKPFQPSPPYQVTVAQINAQADALVQTMKNQTDMAMTQLKEEANAIRTYFEESVKSQNAAQERYLRAVSEATERMQELRLAKTKAQGSPDDGHAVASAVALAEKAIRDNQLNTARVREEIRGLTDEIKSTKKPRKRKITAPSGKVYNVEEG